MGNYCIPCTQVCENNPSTLRRISLDNINVISKKLLNDEFMKEEDPVDMEAFLILVIIYLVLVCAWTLQLVSKENRLFKNLFSNRYS